MALSHAPRTHTGKGAGDARVMAAMCTACGQELVPGHAMRELVPGQVAHEDIQLLFRDEDDIRLLLRDWLDKLDRRLEAWEVKHEQLMLNIRTGGASLSDWLEKHSAFQSDSPSVDALAGDGSRLLRANSEKIQGAYNPENAQSMGIISDVSVEDNVQPTNSMASIGTNVQETPSQAEINNKTMRMTLSQTEALKGRRDMQAKLEACHQKLSEKEIVSSTGPLEKLVTHRYFDHFISFAIFSNAIFVGVQTEMAAQGLNTEQGLFMIADLGFFAMFSVELIMRILVYRLDFLKSTWNIFDTCLVLMQLFEFALKLFGASMDAKGAGTSRVMRVFRIVRIVRVFRLLRFMMQLRVMIRMIMLSLDSLFWLMILLLAMMYMFAIVFTQGVHDYLSMEATHRKVDMRLKHNFGDLVSSSFTLFQIITNGVGWGALCEDLFTVQAFFGILMIMFIFFAFFSVLNIVTGVFVDSAIQHAGQEREQLVEKEQKSLEKMSIKLMELLHEVDTDKSGTITFDELVACAEDEKTSSYLAALEIHTPETRTLFKFLDKDGSGEIDIQEFIDGCLRIRGSAKSIDLHMLLFALEHEQKVMHKRYEHIEKEFEVICQVLTSLLVSWQNHHSDSLKAGPLPASSGGAASNLPQRSSLSSTSAGDRLDDIPREGSEAKVGKAFPRSRVTACKSEAESKIHVHVET